MTDNSEIKQWLAEAVADVGYMSYVEIRLRSQDTENFMTARQIAALLPHDRKYRCSTIKNGNGAVRIGQKYS